MIAITSRIPVPLFIEIGKKKSSDSFGSIKIAKAVLRRENTDGFKLYYKGPVSKQHGTGPHIA